MGPIRSNSPLFTGAFAMERTRCSEMWYSRANLGIGVRPSESRRTMRRGRGKLLNATSNATGSVSSLIAPSFLGVQNDSREVLAESRGLSLTRLGWVVTHLVIAFRSGPTPPSTLIDALTLKASR